MFPLVERRRANPSDPVNSDYVEYYTATGEFVCAVTEHRAPHPHNPGYLRVEHRTVPGGELFHVSVLPVPQANTNTLPKAA